MWAQRGDTALAMLVMLGLIVGVYQYEQRTSLKGVEKYLQFKVPPSATQLDYGRGILFSNTAFLNFTATPEAFLSIQADLDAICPETPLIINTFSRMEQQEFAYRAFAFASERCLKNDKEYWVNIDWVANYYYVVGIGLAEQP